MLCLRGHAGEITDIGISPDNSTLVTAAQDRTMRVWDARTGALLTVLYGHTADVVASCFMPSASVVVSASADGTCRVWDLRAHDR
ncbi:unnamed protein product [Ectocarpus sp. 6 AP-2014]